MHSLTADTQLLPEFHAMRYYAREAVRLAFSSFLQHRTLDVADIDARAGRDEAFGGRPPYP